jgi:carbon storage regulator
MLVIRRKREQVIRIGDSIEVTVLEIEHGQVKLGISAPRDIPVYREELAATRQSNQGAALAAAAWKALESYAPYPEQSSPAPKTVSISTVLS